MSTANEHPSSPMSPTAGSPTSPISPMAGSPTSSSGRRRPSHRPHGDDPSTEHLCRYPSKLCYNTRALKRDGEWHNLCDVHRAKANNNQRRLEQKRRTERGWSHTSVGNTTKSNVNSYPYPQAAPGRVQQPHAQQSYRSNRSLESLLRLDSLEESDMDGTFGSYEAPLFDAMDVEVLDALICNLPPSNMHRDNTVVI